MAKGDKAKEKGGKKKKVDPNRPKKPPTAYVLFCTDYRSKVKESHPSASFAELNKVLGSTWQALPESEKEKYKQKATTKMSAYKTELEEYKKNNPEPEPASGDEGSGSEGEATNNKRKKKEKGEQKAKKRKKDPNAPKNPTSAYFFFQNDTRPRIKSEHPGITQAELTKQIAAEWKNLSEEDKKPFSEKAAVDKERYTREKAEYEQNKPKTAPAPKKKAAKKEESDDESDSSSGSDSESASSSDEPSD